MHHAIDAPLHLRQTNSVHAFITVSCICYCRSFRKKKILHHLLHVNSPPPTHLFTWRKLGRKEWMFPILSTLESLAGSFFFFFFKVAFGPRFLLFLQNAPFGFMLPIMCMIWHVACFRCGLELPGVWSLEMCQTRLLSSIVVSWLKQNPSSAKIENKRKKWLMTISLSINVCFLNVHIFTATIAVMILALAFCHFQLFECWTNFKITQVDGF